MIESPISIQCRICKASLDRIMNEGVLPRGLSFGRPPCRDDIIKSDTFCAFGLLNVTYSLNFKKFNENFGIYFVVEIGGEELVEAELQISIESANLLQNFNFIYHISANTNALNIAGTDLMDPQKGYIIDGYMNIKITGCLRGGRNTDIIVAMTQQMTWKCEELGECMWKNDDKDFSIFVNGREIKAHKTILAARSEVFKAMLQPHTKEAQESKVVIHGFEFEVVEIAIKLCYSPSLVNPFVTEVAMSLLEFAEMYNLQTIKENIENRLMNELNPTNVCAFIKLSYNTNARNLQIKSTECLRFCFGKHPIANFDILDKDFALDLFKNSFCNFINC